MALDNDKVFKVSNINVYTADVGTAFPANLDTLAGWDHIGHTSQEDLLAFNTEGGESTVLGSNQEASLRQSTTPVTRSFNVNALQFLDPKVLQMYYGSGAKVTGANKKVEVYGTNTPLEKAVLVILTEGTKKMCLHAHKASFIAATDIGLNDTNSLAQVPIKVTPLASGANPVFTWTLP